MYPITQAAPKSEPPQNTSKLPRVKTFDNLNDAAKAAFYPEEQLEADMVYNRSMLDKLLKEHNAAPEEALNIAERTQVYTKILCDLIDKKKFYKDQKKHHQQYEKTLAELLKTIKPAETKAIKPAETFVLNRNIHDEVNDFISAKDPFLKAKEKGLNKIQNIPKAPPFKDPFLKEKSKESESKKILHSFNLSKAKEADIFDKVKNVIQKTPAIIPKISTPIEIDHAQPASENKPNKKPGCSPKNCSML